VLDIWVIAVIILCDKTEVSSWDVLLVFLISPILGEAKLWNVDCTSCKKWSSTGWNWTNCTRYNPVQSHGKSTALYQIAKTVSNSLLQHQFLRKFAWRTEANQTLRILLLLSNLIQNIKEQFHHSTVRGQKWIFGAVRGWLNHCIMEGSWHKWWLRSEVNSQARNL